MTTSSAAASTSIGMVFVCVFGALIALLVGQIMPEVSKLHFGGEWTTVGRRQAAIVLFWVIAFGVIGVAVAILAQPTTASDALRDGLAWQGLLGGGFRTVQCGIKGADSKRATERNAAGGESDHHDLPPRSRLGLAVRWTIDGLATGGASALRSRDGRHPKASDAQSAA